MSSTDDPVAPVLNSDVRNRELLTQQLKRAVQRKDYQQAALLQSEIDALSTANTPSLKGRRSSLPSALPSNLARIEILKAELSDAKDLGNFRLCLEIQEKIKRLEVDSGLKSSASDNITSEKNIGNTGNRRSLSIRAPPPPRPISQSGFAYKSNGHTGPVWRVPGVTNLLVGAWIRRDGYNQVTTARNAWIRFTGAMAFAADLLQWRSGTLSGASPENHVIDKVAAAMKDGVNNAQLLPVFNKEAARLQEFLVAFTTRMRQLRKGELIVFPAGWAREDVCFQDQF